MEEAGFELLWVRAPAPPPAAGALGGEAGAGAVTGAAPGAAAASASAAAACAASFDPEAAMAEALAAGGGAAGGGGGGRGGGGDVEVVRADAAGGGGGGLYFGVLRLSDARVVRDGPAPDGFGPTGGLAAGARARSVSEALRLPASAGGAASGGAREPVLFARSRVGLGDEYTLVCRL